MNKERQLALQDPVTNSIHAYLSVSPADLCYPENAWAFPSLPYRKIQISEAWKGYRAQSDLLHSLWEHDG
jgi:hypothetical protein